MKHFYITTLIVSSLSTGFGCAHAQNSSKAQNAAETYVSQLDTSCTYDDGYTCIDNSDTSFTSIDATSKMLSAPYLTAWPVAYADFKQLPELSAEQKQLTHYKIGFAETNDEYIILFNALLMPYVEKGKASGISTAPFGRSIKYWVNKSNLSIRQKLYLK